MSEIEEQLREYAADNGYSHLDYSDVMLMGADRIAELERKLAERGEAVGEVIEPRGYYGERIVAWFDDAPCAGTMIYTGPQVPEGWQIVPKVASEAQIYRAFRELDGTATQSHFNDLALQGMYQAFLAAAPKSGVTK